MHSTRPYIIVPLLIEQPTWGGDYIPRLKGLGHLLDQKKIGQSYELFEHSLLSTAYKTSHHPTVALAAPDDVLNHKIISGEKNQTFKIDELYGGDSKIDTLIKLNQATGNSYQLHVKEETDKWKPKPESWYFMESGLVSLGVKPDADWVDYEQTCRQVEAMAEKLSQQVRDKKLPLDQARTKLQQYVATNNPQDYVNLLQVGRNQAIDLTECGVHHSWEEHDHSHPHGNVVYEVQKNVYDPESTIRSFDRGKIKDDGSLRPVQIDDYFKFIDRSETANDPETHFRKGKLLKKSSTYTVREMFSTRYYHLYKLSLSGSVSNKFTEVENSFHHLFAQEGNFTLDWNDSTWTITQGFSLFLPPNIGSYQLKPFKSRHATILQTKL